MTVDSTHSDETDFETVSTKTQSKVGLELVEPWQIMLCENRLCRN